MLPLWRLTLRQLLDVELILNGGFTPLAGFLSEADYESVLRNIRLLSGALWPIPINLDVPQSFADSISIGDEVCLLNLDNDPIAILNVTDKWFPNKTTEAMNIFGTNNEIHPGVNYLYYQTERVYLGGPLKKIQLPKYYDFVELRKTPAELKDYFRKKGWKKIIGFQTRNPMHRAHYELTLYAAKQEKANLLIHPVVGITKPGDIDSQTRIRCYKKLMNYYDPKMALLNLLPLAMRMAGPREALWHALIRKNYGCTHFIVGRDHAGPGFDQNGIPFYDPYASQTLTSQYANEIGIKIIPLPKIAYVKERRCYIPVTEMKQNETLMEISGTQFRRLLEEGAKIPEWFSFPSITKELCKRYPPKFKRGIALLLTGLSGAGKSTIAKILLSKLGEYSSRNITLLDGDIARKILSNELGFSKSHRDMHIKRVGYIASEIVKHRGIIICAQIAPYAKTRKIVREIVSESGLFLEIYIKASLSVCEQRDPKGLYAKARAGLIEEFTGIDSPYEPPQFPEIVLNTEILSPEAAADKVIQYLLENNYLRSESKKRRLTSEVFA